MKLKEILETRGVEFSLKNKKVEDSYAWLVKTLSQKDAENNPAIVQRMMQNSGSISGIEKLMLLSVKRKVEGQVIGMTLFNEDEAYAVYERNELAKHSIIGNSAHEGTHLLAAPSYNLVKHDIPFAYAFGFLNLLKKDIRLFDEALLHSFFRGLKLENIPSIAGKIKLREFCDSEAQSDGIMLAVQAFELSGEYEKEAGSLFLGLCHDYLDSDRAELETRSFYKAKMELRK